MNPERGKYSVVLRNFDRKEISSRYECETLKEAKERLQYLASYLWALEHESTHSVGDRAIILNRADEIVFDMLAEITREEQERFDRERIEQARIADWEDNTSN